MLITRYVEQLGGTHVTKSKYPPAKPGALGFEPLKAAGRIASVCLSAYAPLRKRLTDMSVK
jgi:hypothetical protein